MKTQASLRVVPVLEIGEDTIFTFLLENFFFDEPMNAQLKRKPGMDEFKPMEYLKEGHSFIALVKDGGKVSSPIPLRPERRSPFEYPSRRTSPD